MSEAPATVAVIDLGSNSARLVLFTLCDGNLDVLRDARASLKLLRHIDADGNLDEAGLESAVEVLTGFRALAGRGTPILAAGTSALRGTGDPAAIIAELKRRTRITVRLLDGSEEAELACLGAIHGLPLSDGLVLDIGGGSMELAAFKDRRLATTWTYPLGALRVSDTTLHSDPPTKAQLRSVASLVAENLAAGGRPELPSGGGLVATGGTARAIAKVHRAHFPHLLDQLHGYRMTREDVDRVFDRLTSTSSDRLRRVAGVGGRADSIMGGTAVIRATMDFVDAGHLVVSGHGLREGIALQHFGLVGTDPAANRRVSVEALAQRFATTDRSAALRRSALAVVISQAISGTDAAIAEALHEAATLCDAGRAISRGSAFEQAAHLVLAADLAGFGHTETARVAAILERAGDPRSTLGHYRRAFGRDEFERIETAAMALRIADEVEPWLPAGDAVATVTLTPRKLTIRTALTAPCRPALSERWVRSRLNRELVVTDGESGPASVPLEVR